jgi:hypothetical protein
MKISCHKQEAQEKRRFKYLATLESNHTTLLSETLRSPNKAIMWPRQPVQMPEVQFDQALETFHLLPFAFQLVPSTFSLNT